MSNLIGTFETNMSKSKKHKGYLLILIFQGNETPRRRKWSETIATRYSRVATSESKQNMIDSCFFQAVLQY